MEQRQFAEFASLYDEVMGLYGKGVVATQKAVFFRALERFSFETVKAAFDAHITDAQRGRFAPMPADLIAQIESARAADGRPDAEEAWSIAVRAADESATVVWTQEIAEAWGQCKPVMDLGDEVGARMAFKSTYARLLASARATRQPVQWSPTLGYDEARRIDALTTAVVAGKLPAAYLPAPAGAVAGLLELSKVRGCPPAVAARLLEIRQQVMANGDGPSRDAEAKQRTAEAKAITAEAIARYTGGERAA